MAKGGLVGRLFDVAYWPNFYTPTLRLLRTFPQIDHPVVPAFQGDMVELPVPFVIYRAAHDYLKYSLGGKDTPIYAGDVIMTDQHTTLVIEELIGARVGVTRNAAVKMLEEGGAVALQDGDWVKITLNSGGMFAKFHRTQRPLTVQTQGGVLGIKG